MPKRVYIFINGILTKPSDTDAWTDRAEAWIIGNTEYKATKFEYFSGAITRRLFQNARVDMVRKIVEPYLKDNYEVVLVGHSNGCDIICRLIDKYHAVRATEIHLIAAACEHDFRKNGLALAMRTGRVGKVYCYLSHNDKSLSTAVVSSWLLSWIGLGYGYLGLVGPSNAPNAGRTMVRWDDSKDHSDWFLRGGNFVETMHLLVHAKPFTE